MIDSALAVLVRVLNTHPQKSLSLTEPVVPAAPVVDLDGLKLLARATEFFGTQPVIASTAIPGVAGIKLTPKRIGNDDLEEL